MESIVAGVVGAVIGLAGVLLGTWTASRSEDRRWLRDQRLSGATELITAGGHLYEYKRRPIKRSESTTGTDVMDWENRLQNGRSVIHLLCAEETRTLADELAKRVWCTDDSTDDVRHRETVEVLRAFTEQLRRELGSR